MGEFTGQQREANGLEAEGAANTGNLTLSSEKSLSGDFEWQRPESKAVRSTHWGWSGDGGSVIPDVQGLGLTLPCSSVKEQWSEELPTSLSSSLPEAITRTAIRCCRQVPGRFPLSLARPLTAAPAVSHQREHTSESRLMRLSPDKWLQREREAGEGS